MLLSLLPLLLQVVTASGDHLPPPVEVRATSTAQSIEYHVTAFLKADLPIRPDTPWLEYLWADERRLRRQLDQLGPGTAPMQANIVCRGVARFRLVDCRINDVDPDTSDNRPLALALVRAMRVNAPSAPAEFVSVDLYLGRRMIPRGDGHSPCLPPFCMIEMSLPPLPPPPPAK